MTIDIWEWRATGNRKDGRREKKRNEEYWIGARKRLTATDSQ